MYFTVGKYMMMIIIIISVVEQDQFIFWIYVCNFVEGAEVFHRGLRTKPMPI